MLVAKSGAKEGRDKKISMEINEKR